VLFRFLILLGLAVAPASFAVEPTRGELAQHGRRHRQHVAQRRLGDEFTRPLESAPHEPMSHAAGVKPFASGRLRR